MPSDFIISNQRGGWRIAARSERGKSFAAADPRFDGGKSKLAAAETLAIYQELHDRGYYAETPDGLPPPGRGLIVSRLALLLALLLVPMMLFVLLA